MNQTGRDDCYFCGSEGPLETHHIVPRRFDGTDHDSNLVDLCPTCHERLERLYDKRFFARVGAEELDEQVQVIVGDAIDELENFADDLYHRASGMRSDYIDTDVQDLRERAAMKAIEDAAADNTEQSQALRQIVSVLADNSDHGAHIDQVYAMAKENGMGETEVTEKLSQLRDRGEVYEPETNYLRRT